MSETAARGLLHTAQAWARGSRVKLRDDQNKIIDQLLAAIETDLNKGRFAAAGNTASELIRFFTR